ncbi:histidine kinase [Sulfolobus acidocaldarius SUSAZ]|nr:histidine kinase [Sulfolobus acidocaldarius SUSAZ]
MQIKTIMLQDPPVLSLYDKLYDAFKRINTRGIGRVIIVDKSLEGIVSTRDLISCIVDACEKTCNQAQLYELLNKEISKVMSPKPAYVYEDDDVIDALTIMVARNLGSLPVIDVEKKVKGIVTEREMMLIFQDLDHVYPVSKFMTKRVTTIYEDMPVVEGAKLMVKRGFRRLPVVDTEGKLVGVITAADILKNFLKHLSKNNLDTFYYEKIKDIKTPHVHTIDPNKSINEAAAKMLLERIGSLIVVDNDNVPTAIVTERDLIIALHYQLHLAR